MGIEQNFVRSLEISNWIDQRLSDLQTDLTIKSRTAVGCWFTALMHHRSMVILMMSGLHGSAYALMRCTLEAYIRGCWVYLGASDDAILKFSEGNDPPPMRVMISEMTVTPGEQIVAGVDVYFAKNWGALCDFAHTGIRQIDRQFSGDSTAFDYTDNEILPTLRTAEIVAFGSAHMLAKIGGHTVVAHDILDEAKQHIQNDITS